ncbi:MAG TPA: hypothetical protein VL371_02800 [Gemmataceae bacterium]|nr:hypothetical protein [Gemmataceae bacterium]
MAWLVGDDIEAAAGAIANRGGTFIIVGVVNGCWCIERPWP